MEGKSSDIRFSGAFFTAVGAPCHGLPWTGLRATRETPNRHMADSESKPKIHVRGDKRLDGVLDFVAFAAKPMPLVTLLDEAPRRIAAICEADVCSLYLLEGEGNELV